jgi:hypothetical protein
MSGKHYTYIEGNPFYLPQCENINGVLRLNATSLSLDSKYPDDVNLIVPKRLLEREIRRILEECMVHGGGIDDMTCRCISGIEADLAFEIKDPQV